MTKRFPPVMPDRYHSDQRGNVTLLFALSVVAVFFAVGVAVDYIRFSDTKTHFVAAVDAAALQVANSDKTGKHEQEELATTLIHHNYSENRFGDVLEVKVNSTAQTVTLDTKVRYNTSFMRLAGIFSIDVPISSEVTRSGKNIEVALVLDITDSMDDPTPDGIAKIVSLKSAASKFIDDVVWPKQTPYYSKVALIPYSYGVNVASIATTVRGVPTSGTCTTPGCTKYRFTSKSGTTTTLDITNCVTERNGTEAFTDADVPANKLKPFYAMYQSECVPTEMMPLSANAGNLKARINALDTVGATAGHLGIQWGWYSISRDTGLWSGASEPAAYGTNKLAKVAVIMTDGMFNTEYCNGVVDKAATVSSGYLPNSRRINCNSPNGSAQTQALALCSGMKAKGIEVYTIGFDITAGSAEESLLQGCSSGSGHYFRAEDGAALDAAFKTIGKGISELRLSR